MPQRVFTSDELVAFVRRQGRCPNKAVTGSQDKDLLELLNEAMLSVIVPVIRKAREEYFVYSQRIALTTGQKRVPIPTRAVGRQVRDVCYFDGQNRQRILVLPRERITDFTSDAVTGTPCALYVEGNDLVFAENFQGGGYLEVSYLALPGQLVALSEGRLISGVDTATNTFTLQVSAPASWDEGMPTFDVHGAKSGGELRLIGLTTADVDGQTIQVNEPIDGSTYGTTKPQAGDYICLEGEAVIPAIPIEWHIPLGWAAVMMWHQSQGNLEHAAACKETLGEFIQNEKGILSDRVESHPKKVAWYNPLWHGTGFYGGN